MAKTSTKWVCQACAASSPRWLGKCPACGGWNTLVEEVARKERPGAGRAADRSVAKALPIGQVSEDAAARIPTGIAELDRVLGGGAVLGSVMLVGGDPGVGKSTLLLQALSGLAGRGATVLYVSGEESTAQIALRARRLGLLSGPQAASVSEKLILASASDVAEVEQQVLGHHPVSVVVDSVQVLRSADLESAPGSVSQLREVTSRLVELAKTQGLALFLVGHVTKDGSLAGPKVLEHLVDVVLGFEGERGHAFRVLRASKNRFGSATEVGVFEMSAGGLTEVPNPSALFLAERPAFAPGSLIAAVLPEAGGTRAVLVEVQTLLGSGAGRRTTSGVDQNRLAMILAVLERHAGLSFLGFDVFANVAGGLSIDEPALDLPLALSLASALRKLPCQPHLTAFGELGLAGEVRGVSRAAARLSEAASMGFRHAILPASTADRLAKGDSHGLTLMPVKSLNEALELVFDA